MSVSICGTAKRPFFFLSPHLSRYADTQQANRFGTSDHRQASLFQTRSHVLGRANRCFGYMFQLIPISVFEPFLGPSRVSPQIAFRQPGTSRELQLYKSWDGQTIFSSELEPVGRFIRKYQQQIYRRTRIRIRRGKKLYDACSLKYGRERPGMVQTSQG